MESSTSQRNMEKNLDRVSQGAHQAVDRAASAASSVVNRVGEKGEEWMEMKDNWVEGASTYVREHPIAALGIAAAAGYLFSMISRWR
jgi:ElaB/YqjD/DUF883 family membrane-anchored ribosome-binding protein